MPPGSLYIDLTTLAPMKRNSVISLFFHTIFFCCFAGASVLHAQVTYPTTPTTTPIVPKTPVTVPSNDVPVITAPTLPGQVQQQNTQNSQNQNGQYNNTPANSKFPNALPQAPTGSGATSGKQRPAYQRNNMPVIRTNQRLPSEIMADKKWTWNRKFFQNMETRYNYYFHAKQKMNAAVRGIGLQWQDDYNHLLPFYPYNVKNLGINNTDLDSVIIKASTGIQLHDPRGKWIPDAYLLIGEAYYYLADYPNADATFRFINTKYAPKSKSQYKAIVGSNENNRNGTAITVATKEKTKGFFRFFQHKAVRNDAFLWRARTLLEQENYDEVRSLINVLINDPNYPKRLQPGLAEVQAYSLYRQEKYAEAIAPLRKAADTKGDKYAKARMRFILGQLYQRFHKRDSALAEYHHVVALKPDPIMDFQARLAIAGMNAGASGGSLEQSMAILQNMLKKDRFTIYHDIIYYNMALLQAEYKHPPEAIALLQKSLRAGSDNMFQRTMTYKALADIYYNGKDYTQARKYYDSTATFMTPDFAEAKLVNTRKNVLDDVVKKKAIIRQEDSLQRIAAMSEPDRVKYLQVLVAQLKQQATQQELAANSPGNNYNYNPNLPGQQLVSGVPMPGNNSIDANQAEWYFYNPNSKSVGFTEFKKRWGNRPLADNWQRSSAGTPVSLEPKPDATIDPALLLTSDVKPDSISAQLLVKNLPLTTEKLQASRVKQQDAMFDLGKIYHDKLEDAQMAIETYDSLLIKYPDHPKKEEVLYSLYIWYGQLNQQDRSNKYKQIILTQYPTSNFANIIQYGNKPADTNAGKIREIAAAYDTAYLQYLTGRYPEALDQISKIDTTYGYSSLQSKIDLLQAITYIKIDTSATRGTAALQTVVKKYPLDTAIQQQALAILDALSRRQQVTDYLTHLQVQRQNNNGQVVDEHVSMIYPWQRQQMHLDSLRNKALQDSLMKTAADSLAKIQADSIAKANLPPPKPVTPYKLPNETAAVPHFVVLRFTRVDKALLEDVLNQFTRYNAAQHPNDKIEVSSFVLTPTDIMLIFRLFPNENASLEYYDELRIAAPDKIIPRVRETDYQMFIISRDNFILLNSTKDLQGYMQFFQQNYMTQQ
ncbi:Tetratricopeptide (TPR) repeat [Chitinophaga costaii]|uniref:Tetratricopeptide (TPR) repeat n=2 Tax=Chitinophaga costaii TaxID=1335309 RepID=A0A1C4DBT8_9BACT|nr:Tetratricopeptide (TPR) repeat [Chitinophaga costaii]